MAGSDLAIADGQIWGAGERHKCLLLRVRPSVSQRATLAPQGSLVARKQTSIRAVPSAASAAGSLLLPQW